MKPLFWMVPTVALVVFGAAWLSHRRLQSSELQSHAPESAVAPAPPPASGPTQPQQPPSSESATNNPPAPPPTPQPEHATPPPSHDTISRDPPNGMIFGGTGKYQLYRQGDITWRLNTDTGFACVLFATDAQWSKPRVFEHGCASAQTVSR